MATKKRTSRAGAQDEPRHDCILRVPQTLASYVDRYVAVMQRREPGLTVSRGDAVRSLLYKALLAEKLVTEEEVFGVQPGSAGSQ